MEEPIQVHIAINGQTASVRTRRVIKRNGHDFLLFPKYAKPGHVFVRLQHGAGWSGWLPSREIKVTQPNKSEDKHAIAKNDDTYR